MKEEKPLKHVSKLYLREDLMQKLVPRQFTIPTVYLQSELLLVSTLNQSDMKRK